MDLEIDLAADLEFPAGLVISAQWTKAHLTV